MDWDVLDFDDDLEYFEMGEGRGMNVKLWLNWDIEYRVWKIVNLKVDVFV